MSFLFMKKEEKGNKNDYKNIYGKMGVQTLRQSSDCLLFLLKVCRVRTVKPIQKDKKLKSSNFAKLLCFRNVNIERLKE